VCRNLSALYARIVGPLRGEDQEESEIAAEIERAGWERLDRWGRSATDLPAALQELEHLGVGFVSVTETLDLTTPTGRAMAGLPAVFAEFEREILRERVRAGPEHAWRNGQHLGGPLTVGRARAHSRRRARSRPPLRHSARLQTACGSSAHWPGLLPGPSHAPFPRLNRSRENTCNW